MKLGIEREKIGDIIVHNDGAEILTFSHIANSLIELLSSLTRFSKSTIVLNSTKNLIPAEIKKEEFNIIIPSLRLDSVVAELAHTSRTKALEIISDERVFVNFEISQKSSKPINYGDIITIRGKGRFEIGFQIGTTKSNNLVVCVYKYV